MEVFTDPLEKSININTTNEFEHQWKLFNARFEYAWRYFAFHATQRTTMFNFFVVFSGFLINACILLFQKGDYLILLTASLFGIAITLSFICLERRNEELVHAGEDILRTLENEVLFKDFRREIKWPKRRDWWGNMIESDKMIPLGVLIREDYDERQEQKSKYSHGTWLPRIEGTIAFLYVLFALYALGVLLGVLKDKKTLAPFYSLWQFVAP